MKKEIEFTAQQALTKIVSRWEALDSNAFLSFMASNLEDFKELAEHGAIKYMRVK